MAAKVPGRVITLVRRENHPAFVMMPGAGGGFGPYVRLASQIGERHSVHVIRAAGLMPGEVPERTIDAMAGSALDALDAAAIVPQAVFGWSMGGAIGWELCVRLAERGELPDLVLVDSSPLPREPTVAADARLRDRIVGMLGLEPSAATLDLVGRTLDAQIAALASYQTRRAYAGRVLLLTCADEDIPGRDESASRWHSLAPQLRAGRLAAGHFDVFDRVHLPELADHIATFLGTTARLAVGAPEHRP
jgi:thioesterase domain-containing protein